MNAIEKAEKGVSKFSIGKSMLGFGIGAAFTALPAFTTPGGIPEKAKAVGGGLAGVAGWELGSKAGMALGAAMGSVVPGLGTAIGAAVGYIGGGILGAVGAEQAFNALADIPDNMVKSVRDKRKLNWVGDQTAFMTQSAHTMRQQSLQAMNRGMTTARSMLGREGAMIHQ